MKKCVVVILTLFLVLVFVSPIIVFAASNTYSKVCGNSTIYMHDLGNLLTDDEESRLVERIGNKCKDVSYNILFLTTSETDGKSTMVYTDDYMDQLFPVDENNIAFVVDMDNREIYINTMGNTILCLTDNMIGIALDKGYDHIVNGEYDDCLQAMADYCIPKLSDNPGAGAVDDSNAFGEFVSGMVGGLIPAVIITGIVIVVLISKHNHANKAQSATTYVSKENYNVIDRDEIFVRSYDKIQKDFYKPKSSYSSSRGGGSSHRSSSGRSHGGGGRKF